MLQRLLDAVGANYTDAYLACKAPLARNLILHAGLTRTLISRFNRHMANRLYINKVNSL